LTERYWIKRPLVDFCGHRMERHRMEEEEE